ncbi:MAG: DUF4430 domain-containing protein [Clostridia bacterium]|nr:DUF4430 domain-containing protein [Clostridia bacterium]
MKQTLHRFLSLTLTLLLIAASATAVTSCQNTPTGEIPETGEGSASTSAPTDDAPETNAVPVVKGEGQKSFSFAVVDGNGKETLYTVKTDQTTVGDALLELGLIEGDESEYGLYVKKVDGIAAAFEVDGTYWAFYVDGEYALSGVDTTEIVEGSSYAFKVEKG